MTDQPTQKLPAVDPGTGSQPTAATAAVPAGTETRAEPCRECGAPLAADQRYCLNCGARRGTQRLPFATTTAAPPPAGDTVTPVPAAIPASDRGPLVLLGGVVALLLALGIGVLLGRGGDSGSEDRAPVVNVDSGAGAVTGAAATPTASTPFASDLPPGTEGWTIQLSSLPSTSDQAAVDAAKAQATTQGAPDVGAVNGDEYPTLTPGQIIVYSGQFPTREAAEEALPALTASFPTAMVVQIGQEAEPDAGSAPEASDEGGPQTDAPAGRPVAPETLAPPPAPEDAARRSRDLPDTVTPDNPLPEIDGEGGQ